MLKFIKHHMETITGIGIYPTISFAIFFLFFIGMLVYYFRSDKDYINKVKNIPLN